MVRIYLIHNLQVWLIGLPGIVFYKKYAHRVRTRSQDITWSSAKNRF